jgi:hypothetical protein
MGDLETGAYHCDDGSILLVAGGRVCRQRACAGPTCCVRWSSAWRRRRDRPNRLDRRTARCGG